MRSGPGAELACCRGKRSNTSRVNTSVKVTVLAWLLSGALGVARAEPAPIELHQVLALPSPQDKTLALTLDACEGEYDAALVELLVARQIPATVFATRRWIDRHPEAVAVLKAHPMLFDLEDHGDRHRAAVIGPGRRVFGVAGSPDLDHLRREVSGGAQAIEHATGTPPRWYRGATAEYDRQALQTIDAMGYRVAGFSLNADEGATLHKKTIIARLQRARPGDIIIAHMNRPASDTAEALAVALPVLQARGFRFVTLRDSEVRPVSPAPVAAVSAACRQGMAKSPHAVRTARNACRS